MVEWPPPLSLVVRRGVVTLIECPLYFFNCLAWEGFALISVNILGDSKFSPSYCFMTGLGAFLGAFIYSTFIILIQAQLSGIDIWSLMPESIARSIAGGITTGTLWQLSVNISEINGYDFTFSFFFVYFMSVTAFFAMMLIIRSANLLLSPKNRFNLQIPSMEMAYYDFMLALCTGASDAFFVGTDNDQYTNGWLSAFDVEDSMSLTQMLCLAGASGLTGFLVFQTLVNFTFPEYWTWVDGMEKSEDSKSDDGGTGGDDEERRQLL